MLETMTAYPFLFDWFGIRPGRNYNRGRYFPAFQLLFGAHYLGGKDAPRGFYQRRGEAAWLGMP
jgi:hypothetical protein